MIEEAKGMKHKPEKNQWKCFRGCERISPGLFSLFPSAVIRINKIQQRKKTDSEFEFKSEAVDAIQATITEFHYIIIM